MDIVEKTKAYEALVAKRKAFKFVLSKLKNPSETSFDVNEIEPWAQWQNNLNAKILIVGQEYADHKTYVNTQGKVERYPDRFEYPSNENLREYIGLLGFDIGHPAQPDKTCPIFLTNAVMGLKDPPMSANFQSVWLKESREAFLSPLIDIINPPVIITLGKAAIKSIGAMYGFRVESMKEALENSPIQKGGKTIFAMYHTGSLGHANRNRTLQMADWKRVAEYI